MSHVFSFRLQVTQKSVKGNFMLVAKLVSQCSNFHCCLLLLQDLSMPAYHVVELRVLSNWGQKEFTCLYRFRVHGKLAPKQNYSMSVSVCNLLSSQHLPYTSHEQCVCSDRSTTLFAAQSTYSKHNVITTVGVAIIVYLLFILPLLDLRALHASDCILTRI